MEVIQVNRRKNRVRRLHALRVGGSSFGCLAGIGLIALLSALSGLTFLIPSFGASSVILFAIPASAYAQPRSLIGGHLISSMIGLICYSSLGIEWWSLSLAVGVAVAAMQLSRTLHPPAAADPLFFMMQNAALSWQAVLVPVIAGSLILVSFAFIYNNWIAKRPYPQYWI
ncbi:MAG: HPP family protein [Sporomusaceae bacterium]|nr:HPP family protein [Sporomusaceae bacterium]